MAAEQGGRDGFALVGVLVFCFILIPVCAVLAQSSRNFAHGVRSDVDSFREELLAGGLADAVAARVGSDRALFDSLSAKVRFCRLADYAIAVSLRDHDGKIDLNNAASELLIAGFKAAGLNGETAGLLQQFVEASRSNTDTPRDILALVEKVSLKHASFEHVDEMQDVLAALDLPDIDMDAFFTVNRGVANVEESSAAPALREELGTLTNQGVVFADNGTFDYVDIVVSLHRLKGSGASTLAKSYRKISPLGDVVDIMTTRLSQNPTFPAEPPSSECAQMFGFQEGS